MKTARRNRGRGGRGGHEPRLLIQAREVRAYELAIQGKSQHEIAVDLQISQPGVSKLLRRVEDRFVKSMAADLQRLRVRIHSQFLHIYSEAIQAFERSKAPINHRRQRKVVGAGQDESTIAELVTDERCGDPRHLEVARRAIVDLWKLAGLDSLPINGGATPNSISEIGTDELKARLQRFLQVLEPEDSSARQPFTPLSPRDAPRPLTPHEAYAEELARRAKAGG